MATFHLDQFSTNLVKKVGNLKKKTTPSCRDIHSSTTCPILHLLYARLNLSSSKFPFIHKSLSGDRPLEVSRTRHHHIFFQGHHHQYHTHTDTRSHRSMRVDTVCYTGKTIARYIEGDYFIVTHRMIAFTNQFSASKQRFLSLEKKHGTNGPMNGRTDLQTVRPRDPPTDTTFHKDSQSHV